ncbi:hypothetical protein PR002_g30048 [Phytophthora rubi]|uniref:Crinkler effector protein N-terminal domain-containing protein n=1 Tax=Phytophthora rubi TaxID=129364 RepID=A0A6A3GVE0_9STRA|nr:hypothetical protein PR002_g30048 [Phytophthora rubi]
MVLLNCAVVGEKGVISIIIEDWNTVALLKDAIKEKNSTTITCDPKDLKLFLAKTDGGWMRDVDPAVLELTEGRIHPDVQTLIDGKRMGETWSIKDVLEANDMATPQSRQVHT